jgi:hypothetical protein
MTQTLANLIRRLLGIKEIHEEEAEQATDEMLTEYLNLSLNEILRTPLKDIVELIIEKEGIHETNMDLFAEVLLIHGKVASDAERKRKFLERAYELYQWLDIKSGIFSIERHQKMNEIKFLLGEQE